MPDTAIKAALDDALAREMPDPCPLPDGEYAIVEVMGHRRYTGRITEVMRYGTTFLAVEQVFGDGLLDQVLIGGSVVFAKTPCSRETAWAARAKHSWQLPDTLADAVTAPAVLAARDPEPPRLLERQDSFLDDPDDIEGGDEY